MEQRVPHYFGPYPNYANSPLTVADALVNISGNGTGATADATVDPATGAIAAITVTAPGTGFTSAPTVTITGSGTSATATAVVDYSGVVNAITVDAGGSGYSAPTVTITGGGATTAATATASGGVAATITLTNGGSGYTVQPLVEFSQPNDPNGVQATGAATMDVNGVVNSITVVSPGSGYTSAPTVTITDGTLQAPGNGTGATAVATLSINAITLNSFGSGYTSAPTVTITDTGAGAGAAATATITTAGGSVTAINVTNPGSGYLTPGIKKFVDTLPGLGPQGENNLHQYIPVGVPDTTTYPGTDYYEIAVVQYRMKFHSSLPPTLLRGYVQLSTSVVPGAHVALSNANLNGGETPIDGYFGVDNPHYLGPTIVATKDRPVRILFRNLLPTGVAGDLFIPVDTTVMGSGMGPLANQTPPMDNGTVDDEVRNPMCNMGFMAGMPDECYTQNRATLHLHGGLTPWISDGTPHQWITPANETTSYPEGVSVKNVPDMPDPGPGAQTFFYTNQQSARLMFYHDHSWGITRLNVYAGEAAGYLVTDDTEKALINNNIIPADQIPLIIQDKTFVPDAPQLAAEDPTWDSARWGGLGSLWTPHVMMPAQNPGDSSGQSSFGRWMYGPWFWPPASPKYGPIANPYYDPNCDSNIILPDGSNQFCEPELIPGVPNQSVGMEAFNDTPVVNGTAYPTTTLDPKSYRFRILNAANDRFWNLQWYVADSTGTEVALNAAEVAAAQLNPDIVPTPDTALSPAGPDWVQIGTEGGFLPAPAVISGHQPTTWIVNPTRFDVGNVDQHSLLVAPAERADVIVDFSKYAGKTLILYNDAPAAFPARVAGYDYYTGDPDMTGSGGAPTTLPGYGPNTRTIMQVKIAAKTAAPTFKMGPLNAAFAHHTDANGKPAGVFESSLDPIIVGQGAYNSAYGTNFRNAAPRDGFARIADQSLTFNTLLTGNSSSNTMTMPFKNKGLHDEMNAAVFDEYGRMSANLGLEAPGATPLTQNIILYPYINPVTEIVDGIQLPDGSLKATPISSAADGTQIWKLTHNGVDTHPIHFHMFNVQVLNRVTWDNIIIKPDANELGWKDTVRVSPLEDTIVAFRPILPKSPFGIPDSIRPLNPAMPIGDGSGFNSVDANGVAITPGITNEVVNFGWEYVWHCHILGHEEMDMMRPIKANAPRALAAAPVLGGSGVSGAPVHLTWTDGTPVDYLQPAFWGNPANEVGYRIERSTNSGAFDVVGQALANATSYTDPSTNANQSYQYRVVAFNAAGDSTSNIITVNSSAPDAAPTALKATVINSSQIDLAWTNNATNAASVRIERALAPGGVPGTFAAIGTVAATTSTYSDKTALPLTTYAYRVIAFNVVGDSLPSNTATATTTDVPPAAPTALSAVLQTGPQVALAWTNNATNATNIVVERALNGGAFTAIDTLPSAAISYTDTTVTASAAGNTYDYRVMASNSGGPSAYSNTASVTIISVPAAPTSLAATAINSSQVNLTWTDNASNETGFRIERALVTNGTPGVFAALGTAAVNAGTYSDTTGTPLTTYAYKVFAVNAGGDSLPSNTATATTTDVPPTAPSVLTAAQLPGLQVGLAWTDNANNETNFVVERSLDGITFAAITTLPANTVSYTDTTVTPGSTYTYQVKASNAGGSSAYSNTASVTISLPSAPTNLVGTGINANQINLSWTDTSTNETGFRIERAPVTNGTVGTFAAIGTVAVNVSTYSDLPNTPLTTYAYRVFAFNLSGDSLPSNTATATTTDMPPAAPSVLSAVLQSGPQVSLAWKDNSANETSFVVERALNGNAFSAIATLPANTITYTDTTAVGNTAGNIYTYRVKAANAGGSSTYTNMVSVTITGGPAAPTNLAAALLYNPTRAQLTWRDNANNETLFVIERSANNGIYMLLATAPARAGTGQTVTYTDNTVLPGTSYTYRVMATNANGSSVYTNIASLIVGAIPAAPSGLSNTLKANPPQITLTWTDNANNETSFQIQRSTNGGAYTLLATVAANTVSYTNTTVTAGNTYNYRVMAVNAIGSSAYSNILVVSFWIPAVPANRTATVVRTGTTDQVTLTWANVTNETGFQIQRATNASFTTGVSTYFVGANILTFQQVTQRGVVYYYRIRAINAVGNSALANFTPFPIVTP
jgi:FtsP/CotA-like multicopper oxidase with cupredoxin domain